MRLARIFPLLALLISGCAGLSTPTPTLTELEAMGIPQTPMGMLPQAIDPESTAVPTLPPADLDDAQTAEMPTLGVTMAIPSSWSAEQIDVTNYEIRDADGNTVISVGQAIGIPMGTEGAKEELTGLLVAQGLETSDFVVEPDVVGINAWVRVRGAGIDACEYRYLPVLLNYIVVKFERTLCDENNQLSTTAFVVLRSVGIFAPTE